jgi:hypothetical protein
MDLQTAAAQRLMAQCLAGFQWRRPEVERISLISDDLDFLWIMGGSSAAAIDPGRVESRKPNLKGDGPPGRLENLFVPS